MSDVLADTEANGPVYAAIAHVWGQRCSDYEPGCPCCDAWAEYDRLSNARADALEEAARVAEDYDGPGIVGGYNRHLGDGYETRRDIAAAIRALKEGK